MTAGRHLAFQHRQRPPPLAEQPRRPRRPEPALRPGVLDPVRHPPHEIAPPKLPRQPQRPRPHLRRIAQELPSRRPGSTRCTEQAATPSARRPARRCRAAPRQSRAAAAPGSTQRRDHRRPTPASPAAASTGPIRASAPLSEASTAAANASPGSPYCRSASIAVRHPASPATRSPSRLASTRSSSRASSLSRYPAPPPPGPAAARGTPRPRRAGRRSPG